MEQCELKSFRGRVGCNVFSFRRRLYYCVRTFTHLNFSTDEISSNKYVLFQRAICVSTFEEDLKFKLRRYYLW